MSTKVENGASAADTFKLALAILVLIGGAVGFYLLEGEWLLWMRILMMLAVVGVSLAIASQTAKGRRTMGFMGEANTELRKVVWPNRQETVQTTLVVILVTILIAVMLWVFDSIFSWAVRLLVT